MSTIRPSTSQPSTSRPSSTPHTSTRRSSVPGDRDVLRWGGRAGVLGSVLLLGVFALVATLVGTFAGPAAEVAAYPDVAVARTVENGLYLLVLVAWVLHLLALHRALRAASPAAALFGSAVGTMSAVVLAAGALPHVVTAPISAAYHAPGVSEAERSVLVTAWEASQSVIDALFVAGVVIAPIGLLLLGAAMVKVPAYGRVLGGTTLALGSAGAAAAVLVLAVPDSPAGAVGILALLVFHLLAGLRTARVARDGGEPGPGSTRVGGAFLTAPRRGGLGT